jgi:hypothetical protein
MGDPLTPYTLTKLYELFNHRSFAGLLILKLDMVDERDSPPGIGFKSTGGRRPFHDLSVGEAAAPPQAENGSGAELPHG